MPTAQRLPSGSWRCQIVVAGKRRSVTAKTKEAAEQAAYELIILDDPVSALPEGCTFREAAEQLIIDKGQIYTPATKQLYRAIIRSLGIISGISLEDLTSEDVQRQLDQLTVNHSRKTVKNAWSFINTVCRYYRPGLHLSVQLPE